MADTPTVSEVVVNARPRTHGGTTTFKPQISVILKKNIGRSSAGDGIAASQRFTGAKRSVDLTPYLGESGSVTVTRSVRQPAGLFSITLADIEALTLGQDESLYGLIEAMDVVEIRMARDTSLYAGFTLNMPLILRGFVSSIRRGQTMTNQGPQRTVTISGQDYGKILQAMRILYLPTSPDVQNLLTTFSLFTVYGVSADTIDASAFLQSIMDNIINQGATKPGFIAAMQAGAPNSPVQFIKTAFQPSAGEVAPFGSQDANDTTAYDLMKKFGDVGTWNELFMTDTETDPVLVFRPTPFKKLDGSMIQSAATPPTSVTVHDDELISLDVGRSDGDVANYYWVNAPNYIWIDPSQLEAGAAGDTGPAPSPFLDTYPNSSTAFYGRRPMRVDSQLGARIVGLQDAEYKAQAAIGIEAISAKRQVLEENNKDNVVLEDGTMTLRGNELIQHGFEVKLVRGPAGNSLSASYYAHTVTHRFMPMRVYLTDVQFDRGMGFVERIQRDGGAAGPYTSEENFGGAYGA